MIVRETEAIESLRSDLASYHIEVREHIARSEARDKAVQILQADIYGLPGKKGSSPGLMGEVHSLKRSRRMFSIAVCAIWSLTAVVIGSIVSAATGR